MPFKMNKDVWNSLTVQSAMASGLFGLATGIFVGKDYGWLAGIFAGFCVLFAFIGFSSYCQRKAEALENDDQL